ncbi:odorant receptor 115-8 [Danio rerio]|uniref:Odorant receptor n=1 Tax=Danio rerio TaxID=7955 RepID=Q2PRI0_DANRE|nr:odorant receptor 115-8 [Danio rerio]XP_005161488.1 odorant receptor, family F, subfamily 115, member 8 isoform X1 [Danio rerio]ABC43287.1 odorant receptor [Danio rerio]|eukprot:NP_001122038.1 odorant receptor, family F, subfamily 115, member 8 [Danio rerio]
MDNLTLTNNVVLVEGLKVTLQSSYPAFILLLLIYVFTMGCNIGLTILILTQKNLHNPMHFLFCNMPVNDIIGSTVIMPRLLQGILREASQRYMTYTECVVQAFFVHVFASVSHSVLIIMAFDRYVAICKPLRYAAIMSNKMVVRLSALAWGVSVIAVTVMIALSLRLSRCRSYIENPFCDNASLFKLSCEEGVVINNLFGIFSTVVMFTFSLGSVFVTYGKIAASFRNRKHNSFNSKAMKTCGTHIALYLIMFVSCAIMIFLHRSPQHSENRKLASIMFHIAPPGLNPLVYGLQTKEIRQNTSKLCSRNKVNVK